METQETQGLKHNISLLFSRFLGEKRVVSKLQETSV